MRDDEMGREKKERRKKKGEGGRKQEVKYKIYGGQGKLLRGSRRKNNVGIDANRNWSQTIINSNTSFFNH